MDIKVYSICHIGKVRDKNQDNYYCNGVIPDTENSNFRYGGSLGASSPLLFGVFDGMGGHLHGERASLYAVQTCEALFSKYKGGNPFGVMNEICLTANTLICEEMENVVKGRMGSTASMLLFEQGTMFICNLGDSPVFLIRGGKISQISYEHTERRNYEQIFGENYDKKKKFRLTQHLGIFPNEMELSPYNNSMPVISGDRFLICSDGLTDMVSQGEIESIVSTEKTVEKAAERLLKAALDNGGRDNTTIILGEISGDIPEPVTEEPETQENYAPHTSAQSFSPAYNAQQQPYQTAQAPSMPYSAPQNIPAQQLDDSRSNRKRAALLTVAIILVAIALVISGFVVFRLLRGSKQDGTATQPSTAAQTQTATTAPSTESGIEDRISSAKEYAVEALDRLGGVIEEQSSENADNQENGDVQTDEYYDEEQ